MRSAIVGCGSIAKVHAHNISKMSNYQLVAFADINIERAEEFSENFGNGKSKAYSSLEEMIEKEKIDILHICTPHYLHVPMTIYAAKHNINVFMEKPLAISHKQFLELSEIRNEVQIGICLQNRYNECVRAVKKLIGDGKAGKVLGARAFVTWNRDEQYYTSSGWRGSMKMEGGGVLINQAIHTLDLLVYFLGNPIAVESTAINHHLKDIIEVEDTIEAYIKFENATACFYATTSYCMDAPVFIELVCENMIIRIEGEEVVCVLPDKSKEVISFNQNHTLGKDYWGNGHYPCIKHFYSCIENHVHFPIDIAEASRSLKLMLGIYDSAKHKKIVDLILRHEK